MVNKITSVEDIVQFFPKLTTLAVYNCPLAGKDTNGREYSALSELKELKYLRLNNCGYTNMSVFEGGELSALKWTEFSDNGRLDDLSPLCRLESLAELKAENNEYVNISGLENAENLRYLYLSNSSFDAEKLAGFTNIETFSARSISPKDTEYIKAMSKLKALYIHNVDFTGCTEKLGELVEELPELTKLSIGSCVFDSVDLLTEQLKKSGSLDTLYVSNTKFADGSELDVSKLFFINDVIHAPDYKWKDSGIRQLYSMTAGTDKIGFAERKNYAENIVSVVIEPSGLKCYDVDIHADTDLRRSEYLSTVTHIDADPDKKISLGDITELFPSASILVVRDTIIDNGDLSELRKLPRLERVVLENCGVNSTAIFGEMKDSKIHTLRLADLGDINDLDALKDLPCLKSLTCAQVNFDPMELSVLSELEWLEIYDNSDERLLSMLEGMKSLRFLAFNKIKLNEDALVDALLRSPSIEELELRYGTVTSVEPIEKLAGMPALKKLDLKESGIASEELQKLSFCDEVIG